MATQPKRKRSVYKPLWFSEEEWGDVVEMMAAVGVRNFSHFARTMILNGRIIVNTRPMDVRRVRAMLSPIGNNINQIARRINIDDVVYLDDLEEIQVLLEKILKNLDRYAKTVEPPPADAPSREREQTKRIHELEQRLADAEERAALAEAHANKATEQAWHEIFEA